MRDSRENRDFIRMYRRIRQRQKSREWNSLTDVNRWILNLLCLATLRFQQGRFAPPAPIFRAAQETIIARLR